nr:aldehyde dehydrogenase family protein [Micromonospora sp. DSM 115978]
MTTANEATLARHQGVSVAVRDFLSTDIPLLLGGAPVPAASGETFEVRDPSSGTVLATVARGGVPDVEAAVVAARRNFDAGSWSRARPSKRQDVLLRFAELVVENAELLGQLDALNTGIPLASAMGATDRAAAHFRYFAGWATKLHGTTIPVSTPDPWLNLTKLEPVGVVAAVIPWNTPIDNAVWKLAAPLAAGCSVILKPAELTPLSAHVLGQLLYEAGLPEGTLSVLHGFGDVGAALAAHPDVDKIAFTGSTEVGREIVRASAGNLKRVSLELGGKSPAIVLDDADLDLAVPGVFDGIFYNAGQICCASSKVLVQESIKERFLAALTDHARNLVLGPPFEETSQMGPVISAGQFERVCSYISDGLAQGAVPLVGGERAARTGTPGYFIEPTIFGEVRPDMRIATEEIFGPVLTVSTFADEAEIGRLANGTIYGLSASVWTRDLGRALRTVDQVRAGIVWVNGHTVLDPASPFGGVKQSGYGKEMGREVLDNYLSVKSVWLRY